LRQPLDDEVNVGSLKTDLDLFVGGQRFGSRENWWGRYLGNYGKQRRGKPQPDGKQAAESAPGPKMGSLHFKVR
jgi:hypothetical protein